MNKPMLKVTPLGGVAQIGSNMTLFSTPSQNIIVDSGILFPKDDFFGINYLIPDLSSLETATDLIITHAHEDHIGAVIHTIEKFPNIRLHAPAFAAALIRTKLHRNSIQKQISIIKEDSVLEFDGLEFHPIHVNHSTPDSFGLLVRDTQNSLSVLYLSDFKCDLNNPYEKTTDLNKIKRLSQKSHLRILFADSTNILHTGKSLSEGDLIDPLHGIIKNSNGRIFITAFPSNIHRLQTIINIAHQEGIPVVPYGRSVINYLETANDLGIIKNYQKTILPSESIQDANRRMIVIASGCQGDFKSTFRRIGTGNDTIFKPQASDLFILSSRTIPGNEKNVAEIINKISEHGAKIITANDDLVHASGHPGHEDLKIIYDAFQPTIAAPIHGESYFLQKHIEFIEDNYPQTTPELLYNFDSISVQSNLEVNIKREEEEVPPTLIHGNALPIERSAISERRKMATAGAIFVSLILGKKSTIKTDLLGLPEVATEQMDELNNFIASQINIIGQKDHEKLNKDLKIAIRRYFNQILGYKPTVTIHIL